ERLKDMLDRYPDVLPALLDLEIVESVAIDNIQRVSDCLDACHGFGVQFSLGDFGTGHSSLSYLKRLRTQTIKIDRLFVRDMLHDADDQALIQALVGLAQAFGRRVVAEGLESLAHGERLMALGCDVAQGDFIAPPMPAEAVLEW
ncbi:GGDEF domain-containing protein, partial [Pseudomonas sp. MWU13-2625]